MDVTTTRNGGRTVHTPAPVRVGDSTAVSKPVIAPFPDAPYTQSFDTANKGLTTCAGTASGDADVKDLCSAVVDVTGNPSLPPYFGSNDTDMLYVASLAKIMPMYAVFELRWRVESHAKKMISDGLSTAKAGWENKVFDELKKAWKPILDAKFPSFPQGFPKLSDIFSLQPNGDVNLAERSPPLTDADLDSIGEFGTPQGKFRDWMRLMLRWSNNEAASKCILDLSYPYINGALSAAGFFNEATKSGLWLSGDYTGHDWLPSGKAGQKLSARWARLQKRSVTNFAGTAMQVARFMTLLAQGNLIDSASCSDMISMMTGEDGIGSYIKVGLQSATPPRAVSSVASKIGYGDDRFSHDCGIVRVERGGDPAKMIRYISVVLGSPPEKGRADLSKLVVGYHDCIVSRHP